jgi:predicted nucleic acid-binding protein
VIHPILRALLLDTGVLGALTHPRTHREVQAWLRRVTEAGHSVFIPEIADYELRCELLRMQTAEGIQRLNDLRTAAGYVRISTEAMLVAAELWAQARRGGYPTAHEHALDGDVILVAQAREVEAAGFEVVVATTNVGHLARFIDARLWQDLPEAMNP